MQCLHNFKANKFDWRQADTKNIKIQNYIDQQLHIISMNNNFLTACTRK